MIFDKDLLYYIVQHSFAGTSEVGLFFNCIFGSLQYVLAANSLEMVPPKFFVHACFAKLPSHF